MAKAMVTSKGQVTVPKEIRDYLSLDSGDRLEFVIHADGSVIIRACKFEMNDLKGILQQKGRRPVSVEDMERAIRKRRSK